MGRQEKPLDAAAGPVPAFAAELRELRRAAGTPTYGAMARRTRYSAATLSRAAAGEQLPSLAVLLEYVRLCGGDPGQWEKRWHRAHEEVSGRPQEMDASDSPYRGLARFEPGDQELFFGRERLLDQLTTLVHAHRLVVVLGPSGSGKSSLLRAGLVPRLRTPDPDGHARPAAVRILTPGEHPLQRHSQALKAASGDGDTWLIVDQAEEVFTLCHDRDERDGFLAALLEAGSPTGRLRIVLGVRADFYGHCLRHPGLAAAIGEACLPVGPLSPDELRRVITAPAATRGHVVERALTARLLEDAAAEEVALPLVSHALLETWRRRRGRTLTLDAYTGTGGLKGAIARTAEAAYHELDARQADVARSLLLRLVAPGLGTADTRRPAARDELEAVRPKEAAAVLERLAKARLITFGDGTVELAHEALITAWPRLHGWIEESREQLRTHRRLTSDACSWNELGRDPGALAPAAVLAAFRALADADVGTHLTPVEREFVEAGVAAQRRTRRRRRVLTAGVAVLAVLAVVAGTLAWQQNREGERRRALSAALRTVALAENMRGIDPVTAARLSIAAWRLAPTKETRAAVLAAATQAWEPEFSPVRGDARDQRAELSPDGSTLILQKGDRIERWDLRTHRRTAAHVLPGAPEPLPPSDAPLGDGSLDPRRLRLSPDGRSAVAVHPRTPTRREQDAGMRPDGSLLLGWERLDVWSLPSGERRVLRRAGPDVLGVHWSADGRHLAVDAGPRAELWDTRAGRRKLSVPGLVYGNAAAVSPDGRWLALCAPDGQAVVWDVNRRAPHFSRPSERRSLAEPDSARCRPGTFRFGPDNDTLLIRSDTGIEQRRLSRREFQTIDEPGAEDLAFSADGKFVAVLKKDSVALWRVAEHEWRLLQRVSLTEEAPTDVRVDVEGGSLRFLGAGGLTVRTLALGQAVRADWRERPGDAVYLSPDGEHLVTHRARGVRHTFQLRGLSDGRLLAELPSLTLPRPARDEGGAHVTGSFSADGRLFAYGAVLDERAATRVKVWDVRRHRAAADVVQPTDGPRPLVYQPALVDDRPVVYALTAAALWDLTRSRRVQGPSVVPESVISEYPFLPPLAVHPDGTLLTVGDGTVIGLPDGRVLRRPDARTGGQAMAFSADGRLYARADHTGRISLFDGRADIRLGVLTDDASPGQPPGQAAHITALAFSADGTTLATGDDRGDVRLWDTGSLQALGDSLPTPGDAVTALTFAHNGTTLHSKGEHTPARTHPLTPEALLPELCDRFGGGLSPREWRARIPDVPYRATC
ncbi:WD40 repeat protein [Streptomyces sp. SAI-170]|uniref:nSTAND1 domain-containing NTPase n=1 Tax=Streptomyces sp. SAI-170 TaxID=3377729 RepID=UPI003C79DBEE